MHGVCQALVAAEFGAQKPPKASVPASVGYPSGKGLPTAWKHGAQEHGTSPHRSTPYAQARQWADTYRWDRDPGKNPMAISMTAQPANLARFCIRYILISNSGWHWIMGTMDADRNRPGRYHSSLVADRGVPDPWYCAAPGPFFLRAAEINNCPNTSLYIGSDSRRGKGRIFEYVTLAATQKLGQETRRIG